MAQMTHRGGVAMPRLRWSKPGDRVWISDEIFIPIGNRKHRAMFRIDGRNLSREGYRVDRGGIMGWEAIDDGQGFRSRTQAQRHVANFIEEAIAQETLTPTGNEWKLARDRSRTRRPRPRSRRDPQQPTLEILSVNRRHPNGTHYLVRVPTTKVRRGYDLVDVIFHANGATSTKSANRLTTTPSIAARFAREHGPSYESSRSRLGMHGI